MKQNDVVDDLQNIQVTTAEEKLPALPCSWNHGSWKQRRERLLHSETERHRQIGN
jgi:hypothetical protein